MPGDSRRRADLDAEAEVVKAPDEPAGQLRLVTARKVVGPEVVVVDAVLEDVIARGEHGRGDGEDGLLRPAATLEAQELRAQVGLLGAHRGPGRLDERGLEPGGARPGPGGPPLARALVQPGTEARPRDQMAGGGKAGHVEADLREDDTGHRL